MINDDWHSLSRVLFSFCISEYKKKIMKAFHSFTSDQNYPNTIFAWNLSVPQPQILLHAVIKVINKNLSFRKRMLGEDDYAHWSFPGLRGLSANHRASCPPQPMLWHTAYATTVTHVLLDRKTENMYMKHIYLCFRFLSVLQSSWMTVKVKVAQSCLTLCDPMDCSPWNSPGHNTGVGSHSLLQGNFPTQGANSGLLHCKHLLYQLSHKGSPLAWQ